MKKFFLIAALCLGMLTATATELTTDNGAQASAQASAKDPVIVLKNDKLYRPGRKVKRLTVLDFNATWCGPCRQFSPVFHDAAKQLANKADFVSIDTDANPETARAFGIEAIPTVIILLPDGQTKTYVGTEDIMPLDKFISKIKKFL